MAVNTSSWIQAVAGQIKTSFKGFMVTLDAIPATMIGFPFNPVAYHDNFDAEYTTLRSPASRHNYPVYSGNTPRVISFTARFDQDYPFSCVLGRDLVADDKQLKHSRLAEARAVFETFKLPKAGILSNVVTTVAGAFTKSFNPGNNPAPPLVLLVMSLDRYAMGYVTKAVVKPLQYNRKMQVTRMEVDVSLLCTPNLITDTTDDTVRLVLSQIATVRNFTG